MDPVRSAPHRHPARRAPGGADTARSQEHPSGRGPFIVPAAKLRRAAGTVRHEVRQAPIEDLATMGASVPEGAPVSVEVTLSSYPGGVMASGTVEAPWTAECRRCGRPVDGEVHATVRERYVDGAEAGVVGTGPGGAQPARAELDDDAYPLEGDLLDLEPLARDAVLLELPLAPLCAEDCLGLCPLCGINRNEEDCSCEQPADPRWSALDVLRDQGPLGEA